MLRFQNVKTISDCDFQFKYIYKTALAVLFPLDASGTDELNPFLILPWKYAM